MRKTCLLWIPALLALPYGCARFEGGFLRSSDAERFLSEIDLRTQAILEDNLEFDLDRCVRVALNNNLSIRSADLEARLAKLNRRIAFANFLPEITFNYTFTELNETPATAILGVVSAPVQDRIVRDTALQAQVPIFAPATWFLYAMHRRGEEIGKIAADYVRRMIALQVTGLYYQCRAADALEGSLEAQGSAARALAAEVEAFYREGMVTDGDVAQARVLLLARETALENHRRARARLTGELLAAMGLFPTAAIRLAESSPRERPSGELGDWILECLMNHPRLAIADRQVSIERDRARIAIAEFLPSLVGFAGRAHTSNSYMTYPYTTAFGFTGLMTLFNGFANINEYRAARIREETAFLSREQESLALMLEVVRVYRHLDDINAQRRLAEAAAAAAETLLAEETAKMREGLLRPSELLDFIARRDAAQVNATNVRYQEQAMIAVAEQTLGRFHYSQKEPEYE